MLTLSLYNWASRCLLNTDCSESHGLFEYSIQGLSATDLPNLPVNALPSLRYPELHHLHSAEFTPNMLKYDILSYSLDANYY